MPKTREQKQQELKSLQDKLEKSKAVVFTSQNGVSVQDIQGLRTSLRDNGSELQSAKKTLVSLLLKSKKLELDLSSVQGGVGVTFSYDDEVAAAKGAKDFSKEHEGFSIIGGILENEIIPSEKVEALAALPSKDELLAKTVGTIKAPISGFVNVLSGSLKNLIGVLNAVKETK